MIVISQALALALSAEAAADLPVIAWDNRVTMGNVEASAEAAGYPASNLANPSTILRWQGTGSGEHIVTVGLDGSKPVDSACFARHNFGTDQRAITLEGLSPDAGAEWEVLVEDMIFPDDAPVMLRFAPTHLAAIRLRIGAGSAAPRMAVLYVGRLLVMERGVQPHKPIVHGRNRNVVTGRSVSGDFLGRIITTASLRTTAEINYLSPDWYRTHLDPFADASAAIPFFFAWNPEAYPREVGFVWLVNDLQPLPADMLGRVNIVLEMEGIAV